MELKVFRDVLPAAGADCTAKAELPLETELLISDYLPPVQRIVKCFAKPVVLQKQLAPGRLTLEGYLRCTVYYQGEEGGGAVPDRAEAALHQGPRAAQLCGHGVDSLRRGPDRIPQLPGRQPPPHRGAGGPTGWW